MPIFTRLTALSLLFFHALALTVPSCTSTSESWDWAYNSIGQSPCLVAGFLFTPCFGYSFSLGPLEPGQHYVGPSLEQVDVESCECGTVLYSLMCACGACQGGGWISWSNYIPNCTAGSLHTLYPYPVPDGTYVPHWALIDVTVEGIWNIAESRALGDTPEVGPGVMVNTPASTPNLSSSPTASTHSSTSTSTSTSSSLPSSGGSSPNVAPIAAGVAGGVLAISAAALIFFFFLRRRRAQQRPATAAVHVGAPHPPIDEVWLQSSHSRAFVTSSFPETRALPMRPYDPDDPTTFPGYQGPDPVLEVHTQVPAVSHTGNLIANTQPLGYHGLPTV